MRKFRKEWNNKQSKRNHAQREWKNVGDQTEAYENNIMKTHAIRTEGYRRTGGNKVTKNKQITLGE